MDICQHLRLILDSKKISQKQICEYLNVATSTFSTWLNRTKSIPSEYIIPICSFLDITPYFLLTGNETSKSDINKNELDLIKIYRSLTTNGQKEAYRRINDIADMEASNEFFVPTCKVKHSIFEVSAGVGAEIGDYEEWDYIEVLKTPDSVKADFCLTIKGDSMQPMFDDEDVILVKDQPVVDVGQICVYNINNNGYVKKFGENKLISLNPEYDDVEIPDQDNNIVECCGLVLGKATVLK